MNLWQCYEQIGKQYWHLKLRLNVGGSACQKYTKIAFVTSAKTLTKTISDKKFSPSCFLLSLTKNRRLWLLHCCSVLTSQWLNTSCGEASPLVRFRTSSAKPKLSATGSVASMSNESEPSRNSSRVTRPSRRPNTAYNLPTKQKISQEYRLASRLFCTYIWLVLFARLMRLLLTLEK